MNRKDFVVIADFLANDAWGLDSPLSKDQHKQLCHLMVKRLKLTNASFNTDLFLQACGYVEGDKNE